MPRSPHRTVIGFIDHEGGLHLLRKKHRQPTYIPPARTQPQHYRTPWALLAVLAVLAIAAGLLLGHWFAPLACPEFRCA